MQAMKMCCTHNIFSYFILFIGPMTNKKNQKALSKRTIFGLDLVMPRVNLTHFGLNSIRYLTAVIWNNLPKLFKKADTLSKLKTHIVKWDGLKCKCPKCTSGHFCRLK